jgi:hypothetical protein
MGIDIKNISTTAPPMRPTGLSLHPSLLSGVTRTVLLEAGVPVLMMGL